MTSATKTGKTLLLSRRSEQSWTRQLRIAVDSLDKELFLAAETEMNDLSWGDYDLVIIDAGAVGDVAEVISQVRSRSGLTRIIVFSASPSWEEARDLLLAGAADYAPKVLQQDQILTVVKRVLRKQVREKQKQD